MADKYWPELDEHGDRTIILDRHVIYVTPPHVFVYSRVPLSGRFVRTTSFSRGDEVIPTWFDHTYSDFDLDSRCPLERRAHVRQLIRQLGYEPTPGGHCHG